MLHIELGFVLLLVNIMENKADILDGTKSEMNSKTIDIDTIDEELQCEENTDIGLEPENETDLQRTNRQKR